jgi:hypothetical protein
MRSEIDLCGFGLMPGELIRPGDWILAHSERDLGFNEGQPERVVSVEKHGPNSAGEVYNRLMLEPLQGGHPRHRWVSFRKHFVVKPG